MRNFTAVVERDPETGLFVGDIPGWTGAHSQGATLDELRENLREVVAMLLRTEIRASKRNLSVHSLSPFESDVACESHPARLSDLILMISLRIRFPGRYHTQKSDDKAGGVVSF